MSRSAIGLRAGLILWLLGSAGCGDGDPALRQPLAYAYPPGAARQCAPPLPLERAAAAGGRVRDRGNSYLVRVPSNHDPAVPHPLLVVFAPAGASALDTERFTRLTPPATRQGFVVAYVDHRPLSLHAVRALAGIADSVAGRWCIDREQVFFAGHSDGATVSTALALLPESRDAVRGIAVSAAGMRRSDAEALGCPPRPLPVMLMHGARDSHFPGWGAGMAAWWAECNRCRQPAAPPDAQGCVEFGACAAAGRVLYCEGPQGHARWPGLQQRLVEFLRTAAARSSEGMGREVR